MRIVNVATEPDAVLAILKEESARYRINNLAFRVFCILILLFMVGATFASYVEWSSLLTMVGLGGATLAATGRHKMAATVAAELRDPRYLGYLIEFLKSEDKNMRTVAEAAVRDILGRIDQPGFGALDAPQRDQLARLLMKTKDLDLAATILGAAKRVGGPEWIRPLEQYAAEPSPMRKSDRDRAISLAKMALADIRMRAAKQRIDAETATKPLGEYASEVLRISNQ